MLPNLKRLPALPVGQGGRLVAGGWLPIYD